MKVTIKKWDAVAFWKWVAPGEDICGICRVQFDGTCPTCKFPGDACPLGWLRPDSPEDGSHDSSGMA